MFRRSVSLPSSGSKNKPSMSRPFYTLRKKSKNSLNERPNEPYCEYGRWGEEKKLLPISETEPWFLSLPIHTLFARNTELSRLMNAVDNVAVFLLKYIIGPTVGHIGGHCRILYTMFSYVTGLYEYVIMHCITLNIRRSSVFCCLGEESPYFEILRKKLKMIMKSHYS
jgi:hypothetical protein